MKYDVVTFGEPMLLLLAADDLPLLSGQRFDVGVAGAESNLAIGLARLNHGVAYFGRVGADTFGVRIQQTLRSEGIDVSALTTDAELPTGILLRDSPQGQPITVEYRRAGSAATALAPEHLPKEMISNTRFLHVTGIIAALSESALEAAEQAMIIARQAGAEVSLDPNIRLRLASPEQWRKIIERLAPHATIIFTGQDEADIICRGVDPEEWYGERGATTVVVKNGASGSREYMHTVASSVEAGVRPVHAVDVVGAGDGFNAGWISAWLNGADSQTPEHAALRLRTGATVAASVVATRGDATGLPTQAILRQLLSNGMDVNR
ncbi:sugar kinase [Paenarthrobacter sp. NPDC089675]|uniref:sugar kinase n=1 Tax=Paenarthrobacter TaxID=1742992 RepID=UPI003819D6FE